MQDAEYFFVQNKLWEKGEEREETVRDCDKQAFQKKKTPNQKNNCKICYGEKSFYALKPLGTGMIRKHCTSSQKSSENEVFHMRPPLTPLTVDIRVFSWGFYPVRCSLGPPLRCAVTQDPKQWFVVALMCQRKTFK